MTVNGMNYKKSSMKAMLTDSRCPFNLRYDVTKYDNPEKNFEVYICTDDLSNVFRPSNYLYLLIRR